MGMGWGEDSQLPRDPGLRQASFLQCPPLGRVSLLVSGEERLTPSLGMIFYLKNISKEIGRLHFESFFLSK